MSRKYKIIVVIVAIVSSFSLGRYTVSVKIKTDTKVVTNEKINDNSTTDKKLDSHTKTFTKEKINKDGSKIITTVTIDDSSLDTTKHEIRTDNKVTSSETSKEVTKGSDALTVSALVGANPFNSPHNLVYGAAVDKRVLGPFSLGIFGLSDGLIGGSVGLSF